MITLVCVILFHVSIEDFEHKNLRKLKTLHCFSITEIMQCLTLDDLSGFFQFYLRYHVFHM